MESLMQFDEKTGFLKFGDSAGAGTEVKLVGTIDLSDKTIDKLANRLKSIQSKLSNIGQPEPKTIERAIDEQGSDVATSKRLVVEKEVINNNDSKTVINDSNTVLETKEKIGQPKTIERAGQPEQKIIEKDKSSDNGFDYTDKIKGGAEEVADAVGGVYAESAKEIYGAINSIGSIITGGFGIALKATKGLYNATKGAAKKTISFFKRTDKKETKAIKKINEIERSEFKKEELDRREQLKLDKKRNRILRKVSSNTGSFLPSLLETVAILGAAKLFLGNIVKILKNAIPVVNKTGAKTKQKESAQTKKDTKEKTSSKLMAGAKSGVVGAVITAGVTAKTINDIVKDDNIPVDGKDGKKDLITEEVGGLAGMTGGFIAGAKIGAMAGAAMPVVIPVTSFIGGLVGAYYGNKGGRAIGDKAGDVMFEKSESKEPVNTVKATENTVLNSSKKTINQETSSLNRVTRTANENNSLLRLDNQRKMITSNLLSKTNSDTMTKQDLVMAIARGESISARQIEKILERDRLEFGKSPLKTENEDVVTAIKSMSKDIRKTIEMAALSTIEPANYVQTLEYQLNERMQSIQQLETVAPILVEQNITNENITKNNIENRFIMGSTSIPEPEMKSLTNGNGQ